MSQNLVHRRCFITFRTKLCPRSRLRGGRCPSRAFTDTGNEEMMRFKGACWMREDGRFAAMPQPGSCLACCSPRRRACAGAEELTADRLLAPDRLIEIQIELPAKDWRELCKQTRDIRPAFTGNLAEDPFTYFKGNITIDGVKIESVGVRKKGFIGSLDDQLAVAQGEVRRVCRSATRQGDRCPHAEQQQARPVAGEPIPDLPSFQCRRCPCAAARTSPA